MYYAPFKWQLPSPAPSDFRMAVPENDKKKMVIYSVESESPLPCTFELRGWMLFHWFHSFPSLKLFLPFLRSV